MGKGFEELLASQHSDAGRNLKKVVASKGKLQGNLYFAGNGKNAAAVVITLTARDPKGQKALAGGKALRKEIKGAKFSRGVVVMDGGKLVVELHAGTATAAMLKKAFKDDTFRKDPVLKLLSRATVRKKGAPGEEDEVEEGTGLSQADLDIAADAFESRGFWRKSELNELLAAQGDLSRANAELQASFLSVSSAKEEQDEQVAEIEEAIAELNEKLNEAVDAGDREAAMAYEVLIDREQKKLAEAQAQGSDPFSGGVVDSSVLALMSRVQEIPLEREALREAHESTQSKRSSGFLKSIFSGIFGGGSGGDSTREGIRGRANDAVWDAEQRERFERVRLEFDSALEPLLIDNGEFERLVRERETAKARTAGARLIDKVQGLIERARAELERVRADLQH